MSWSEKDWQKYVNELIAVDCSLRDVQFQRVPDKVQGDGGIECFATDGHAYQAYADQGSVSTADRATKQKKKITEDLGKLDKNRKVLAKVFHPTRLITWTLLVPVLEDKDVVAHARAKGEEIRKLNLPFVDPTFQVLVKTDDDLPEARRSLAAGGAGRVRLLPDTVAEKDVATLEKTSPLTNGMDKKIKKLPTLGSAAARRDFRRRLLRHHLECDNVLEKLQVKLPEVWERIIASRNENAERLEMTSRLDTTAPNQRVKAVMEDYSKELAEIAGVLDPSTRSAIVRGTVARWLLECPLNFPET